MWKSVPEKGTIFGVGYKMQYYSTEQYHQYIFGMQISKTKTSKELSKMTQKRKKKVKKEEKM